VTTAAAVFVATFIIIRKQTNGGDGMALLELLLADGDGRRGRTDTYYECRRNGRPLTADADECPECGSGVAAYTLR
jgi:hypothetical protein